MYSIRLEVSRFQISKSQKKVLKNVEKKVNSSSSPPMGITVSIEPASFTEEKFNLYRRYQVSVHKDDPGSVTEDGFINFLITSPLIDNVSKAANKATQFGTFHHNYRLNGELIAVGVVDMLPSGLSSVYCFYDNEKRDLVLGKYTALKEIEWCQLNNFSYYYMGYYIHNCEKMKYKGEYKPSELLCPTTRRWFDLETCIPLLEKHKFTPLDPEQAALRNNIASSSDKELEQFIYKVSPAPNVNQLLLAIPNHNRPLHLEDLSDRATQYLVPILQELLSYVGPEVGFRSVVRLA
jgi:arginine-tRNA-protein transferase